MYYAPTDKSVPDHGGGVSTLAYYRIATIFCVNFTFANFASPYSIANIRSQTLINNVWVWFLVGEVNEHRINRRSSSRPNGWP